MFLSYIMLHNIIHRVAIAECALSQYTATTAIDATDASSSTDPTPRGARRNAHYATAPNYRGEPRLGPDTTTLRMLYPYFVGTRKHRAPVLISKFYLAHG